MSIKAIETTYRGYRFRSRLEARWAVYFDDLGLDWAYEPEGYELSGGRKYLPDFFIRNCQMFVEVKGGHPTDDERLLCEDLADQSSLAVLLVRGLPGEYLQHIFCWDQTDSSAGRYRGVGNFRFPSDSPAEFVSDSDWRCGDPRDIYLGHFENGIASRYAPYEAPPHQHAIAAARSARFEHGESGARGK